jgi:hypothetical protein
MRVVSKWFLSITLAILVLAAVPMMVMAATYTDSLRGTEYYATSTEGRFAGTATGALPGSWYIDVFHTPLSPNATITGGTFSLGTVMNGQPTKITGNFAKGTVTQTSGFSGCGNQTYALSGDLVNVGPQGSSHSGTGTFFNGVLTHYRYSFYGSCIPYGASVTGTVNLYF